jgi:hypothetical protein
VARRTLALSLGVLLAAALLAGCTGRTLTPAARRRAYLRRHGIRYSLVEWTAPRPVRLHTVRVRLGRRLGAEAVVAEDPDGDGPAEAALTPPLALADGAEALVFVNANAFRSLPDRRGERDLQWTPSKPVEILGLAAHDGRIESAGESHYVSLWRGAEPRLRLGLPPAPEAVEEGVAGFGWLLRDGAIACQEGGPVHPRTAAGLDRSGRTLWLVVADGRQKGVSEGVTTHELAGYLAELGCHEAVNLDGGGSSVLVLADSTGRFVANEPATTVMGLAVTRPIPNGLAIVRRPRR